MNGAPAHQKKIKKIKGNLKFKKFGWGSGVLNDEGVQKGGMGRDSFAGSGMPGF